MRIIRGSNKPTLSAAYLSHICRSVNSHLHRYSFRFGHDNCDIYTVYRYDAKRNTRRAIYVGDIESVCLSARRLLYLLSNVV